MSSYIIRKETEELIRKHLKVRQASSYTEHGCNIKGDLLIVDCSDYWEIHPRYGVFNSNNSFDFSYIARKLIKEQVPNYKTVERLSIPDLVHEIIKE